MVRTTSVKPSWAPHVIPALGPGVFQLGGAQFLPQIGDIAFRLVQVCLVAGCLVQPVCRIEQLVVEVAGAVEAAGVTVVVYRIAGACGSDLEDVFRMLQVGAPLTFPDFSVQGAVPCRQGSRHFSEYGGAALGCLIIRTGVGTALPHAVGIQLHRSPPGMILLPVAHLEHDLVPQVACRQVIQHKAQVVDVVLHLAACLNAVPILVQPPRQHGRRIRHGQIEFHMVAGIVPATVNKIIGGSVRTPFHPVPRRQMPCLLALVKIQGHLQSGGVVDVRRCPMQTGVLYRQTACCPCKDRPRAGKTDDALVHWFILPYFSCRQPSAAFGIPLLRIGSYRPIQDKYAISFAKSQGCRMLLLHSSKRTPHSCIK